MNTITKLIMIGLLCLMTIGLNAQENEQKDISENNSERIEHLKNLKEKIEREEREFLKVEIESINIRLENGSITEAEAEQLKKEAAKKRAQNIENRMAILENRIDLLKRNEEGYKEGADDIGYVGFSFGDDGNYAGFRINTKNKPRRYDLRTTSDFVFAIGINNAIIENSDLGDSPYEYLGSGFVEMGWAWKTRVFKNSNALRLKYGLSFQWNKLNIKDNQYFLQDGDVTTLEEFEVDLNKSQFRMSNVVIPIHFEFGPSKKIERDTYFRYSTENQFKIGIGGYAGFNIGTQQKLKYKEDGDRVKEKIRKDYNSSDFVYGLSAYVGFGDISLYAKYDLSTIFEDQEIDQNNISLGVRFDLD